MQSKQYFTKIKNYPHEKSTEPCFDPVLNSLSRFTSRSKRFRPFDYACL